LIISRAFATVASRLAAAGQHFRKTLFNRQDYLKLFKTLSTATASRDLKWGVAAGLLIKTGDTACVISVYYLSKQYYNGML
jgi:hypothetical protein